MKLAYAEITEQIIGAAFEVHRVLGYGFLEKVYQQSMKEELRRRGLTPRRSGRSASGTRVRSSATTGPISSSRAS